MDMGLMRGVVTVVLFALFMWLVGWAYSSKRRETFDKLAQMPLEEDADALVPVTQRRSAKP